MKQIIVEVSPDGEVKIEAVGYRGQSCAKATEALEKAMGLPGKSVKKKEYFQTESSAQKVGA